MSRASVRMLRATVWMLRSILWMLLGRCALALHTVITPLLTPSPTGEFISPHKYLQRELRLVTACCSAAVGVDGRRALACESLDSSCNTWSCGGGSQVKSRDARNNCNTVTRVSCNTCNAWSCGGTAEVKAISLWLYLPTEQRGQAPYFIMDARRNGDDNPYFSSGYAVTIVVSIIY
eukprot:8870245-Pyramimonas_sp.AAC.1